MTETMKAVRFHAPGGPEKLKYGDENKPSPPDKGQVLVKVRAIGLIWPELYWPIYQNSAGEYVSHIPGHDFAGTVAALGDECEATGLTVGSEVMAFSSRRNHEGAMAEYAKVDIDQIVEKPKNLSFEEAATIPLSALTAWQSLFTHSDVQKGQRVLVTAGAGPTGMFAIQLAKHAGAYVIATGSTPESKTMVERFGADEYVDYKKTDLSTALEQIDVALDYAGEKVLEQCFSVVKPSGRVVSIATIDAEEKAKQHGISCKFFIVSMNTEQLRQINSMLENGKIRTAVAKTFPLEKTREAFEDGASGHTHGKVVITVPGA